MFCGKCSWAEVAQSFAAGFGACDGGKAVSSIDAKPLSYGTDGMCGIPIGKVFGKSAAPTKITICSEVAFEQAVNIAAFGEGEFTENAF